MDEVEQTKPKSNKNTFSVGWPSDLNNKLEYIKKRTFLSKQQIVLMLCSKSIESWCKTLMDEEVALRTAKVGAPVKKPRAPNHSSWTTPETHRAPRAAPPRPATTFEAPHPAPLPPMPQPLRIPPTYTPSPGWQPPPVITSVRPAIHHPAPSGYPGDVSTYDEPRYDPWTVPLDKVDK